MISVIFDMDGVIFDTEHLALNLWTRAGEELRIPDLPVLYPSVIGTTAVRTSEILFERYGPSFPMEAFNRRVRELYLEH